MSPPDKTAYLSKSLYTRGLQCHKSLYLHKFRPELRSEPTAALEALWKSGNEVGDFAHMLFPGGVIVPFDGLTKDEQLTKTREEIDRGTKAIYEATFSFDDVFVKADIIVRNRGYWDLYEVKSSTSVKEHYWADVAVQYYVLSGCGLPINKAYLVHINNGYVRDGDIVPEELFVLQDITGIVKDKQASIPEELAEMRAMLRGKTPKIDIGPHCEDPYECDFMDHCWQHVPEHSVFSLRGRGIDQWELYRQGVIKLQDVPLDSLNLMQRMQTEYFLDRKSHADPSKIREFLKKVRYPLCFLDFETFNSGIPVFDGTRPYQQVPFQYSLHRIDAEGGEARHFEYLAQPSADPRKEIAQRLVTEIPEGACVIAYNMAFEKMVLRELGRSIPDLRKHLNAIAERMIDLMEPFKRRDIYDWRMNGSYSLKSVLPVLVPEMTYKGLEISDGAMASEAYFTMETISDPAELSKLRKALLEYCKQDTLGLVRLLEKMRAMEVAMSEIPKSPFRVILLAATIVALFASSSLSADSKTLRKEADAGDAKAQFNIGSLYENGSGVKQDYAEAARWYRKAAERGDARAQYNLGIFHQNGWGVPQNHAEAVKWYRKAAMQGAASAQYNLGFMYLNGQGVPQNYAEAAKWYRKAAEQGDVDATRILGLAYYLGKWVPKDLVQSYFWFSLAASRASGDEYRQASEAKDRVAKELTPEKLKEAQRMVTEWEKLHPRKGGS